MRTPPVKHEANELLAVSTDLSQLSVGTGVLPDYWRTTRITSLPKSYLRPPSKTAFNCVQSRS